MNQFKIFCTGSETNCARGKIELQHIHRLGALTIGSNKNYIFKYLTASAYVGLCLICACENQPYAYTKEVFKRSSSQPYFEDFLFCYQVCFHSREHSQQLRLQASRSHP